MGAIFFFYLQELASYSIEGFVPGYTLPLPLSPLSSPFHRILQAVGMIDKAKAGQSSKTNHSGIWFFRVISRLYLEDFAVFHPYLRSTILMAAGCGASIVENFFSHLILSFSRVDRFLPILQVDICFLHIISIEAM